MTNKEQIEALKKQYGTENLRVLALGENQDKEVIVRIPDRTVYNAFDKAMNANNPGKAREVLVENCVLTDKDEVKASDELFLSAAAGLIDLIPLFRPAVRKL